jgi:hypothetical protein
MMLRSIDGFWICEMRHCRLLAPRAFAVGAYRSSWAVRVALPLVPRSDIDLFQIIDERHLKTVLRTPTSHAWSFE